MISALKHAISPRELFLIGLVLVFGPIKNHADQVYRLDEQQHQQLVNSLLTDNQQHQNVPGHFEFEMAPKMEPPSVRKPPYQQSSQLCSGTDPLASFSPRDTLCGDLNQGRLPLNPIGQNVLDQTYPFELIRNKTLQFLARALPVLKLEYETIPKVARYLPTNQLLNPTHMASPLNSEHMRQLNHRFAPGLGSVSTMDDYLGGSNMFLRRRKRSASHSKRSGITVAELSPNATLVVSSAHSAGRIQAVNSSIKAADVSSLAVITKDGYKSIQTHSLNENGANANRQQVSATQRAHNSANYYGGWAPNAQLHHLAKQTTGGQTFVERSGQSAPQSSSPNNTTLSDNNNKSHQKSQHSSTSSYRTRNTGNNAANNANLEHRQHGNIDEANQTTGSKPVEERSIENRMDDSSSVASASSTESAVAARSSGSQPVSSPSGAPAAQQVSRSGGSGGSAQSKQETATKRRQSTCSDSNAFSSTICQAMTMLIDGDKQPAPIWLQALKLFSSTYSGASDSVSSPSNPIWSALSSLTGGQDTSSSGKASGTGNSIAQNKNSLMSLIGPISYLLSGTSAKDSSSVASSAENAGIASQNKEHQAAGSLAGLGSSALAKIALAGWASNALTGLVEYFAPSVFHSASRSFARRKKPYDAAESFVDTPISLAALTSARQGELSSAPGGAGSRQPPTPCPSVEEYISPTFARNYQGAWKYVVQIPHEGYFTQTIQRTSCVRQKCEFTEGVCHESPRWVSLLVAEIYYPNTIFGQPGSQMDTAASSGSIVQQAQQQQQQQQQAQMQQQIQPKMSKDPMQMTDSLHSYNHNLNNAFINMAHELNLDPNNVANMQHLANAYNYQLFHRNGLLPSQQAEARSSFASNAPQMQQAVQQQQQQPNYQQQQQHVALTYPAEYIAALAAMALQQDPNLNVNELINSLQLQRRKKRDISATMRTAQQVPPRNQQAGAQPRSSLVESVPSMNDIGIISQMSGQTHQQLQAPAQFKPPVGANQQQLPAQQSGSFEPPPSPQANGNTNQNVQAESSNPAGSTGGGSDSSGNQVECDGHDKIGCYVVRVYYDWFLVNGSCKCWKTVPSQTAASSQVGTSSAANNFLRRIFTG